MKKLSLLVAVALAVFTFTAGAAFSADTLAEIQKRGKLRVGMEPGYMPFELTNQKGEILVDSKCRTGLAGVFACGDVTNTPFKQVVVAVGDGAKAALSAYNYLINQR